MATGGLPVPAIGATAYSLDIAKQFGLNVTEPRPALVPLSFTAEAFSGFSDLAGLSVPIGISSGTKGARYGACHFNEDVLITHKGLSGPAILQASSYWVEGEPIRIDWLANLDRSGTVRCDKIFNDDEHRLKLTETILASLMPQRLAKAFAEQSNLGGRKWAEVSKKDRQALKELLTN